VKLEDKKILAEWLGEVVSDHIPLGLYMVHRMLLLDKWNPDTDHNDFKEVLRKLTPKQRGELESIVCDRFPEVEKKVPISFMFNDYLWVSDNMSSVMDGVMEVIKDKE